MFRVNDLRIECQISICDTIYISQTNRNNFVFIFCKNILEYLVATQYLISLTVSNKIMV